jgi:hypothetical protein
MKDSLHLLNSDSEQNITGPERKPIRCGTHKFKLLSDRLPAAFPPTDFVLQCSAAELGLVSPSTQTSQGCRTVAVLGFRKATKTTIESDR